MHKVLMKIAAPVVALGLCAPVVAQETRAGERQLEKQMGSLERALAKSESDLAKLRRQVESEQKDIEKARQKLARDEKRLAARQRKLEADTRRSQTQQRELERLRSQVAERTQEIPGDGAEGEEAQPEAGGME
ncbi:MAG TPA: hypothetical protein PKD92_13780 [Novosphingobium sp.]|nr:hypothetical protein [Novosphingobium sp.]